MSAKGRITSKGALLEVRLGNPPPWQDMLEREAGGAAAPQPVAGLAVVDTGAATTMVDPMVADALRAMIAPAFRVQGMQPGEQAWAPQGPGFVDARQVRVTVVGLRPFTVTAGLHPLRPIFGSKVVALIGRDILDCTRMVYDGPARVSPLDG